MMGEICMLAGMILILIYFIFLPVQRLPGEIKVAWYILVLPNFLKILGAYATVVFSLSFIIWANARLYKKALLVFTDDTIQIRGRRVRLLLPVSEIRRVYCMDAKDYQGFLKGKVTFYFEQKHENKLGGLLIRAKLVDYAAVDDFTNQLMAYESLELKVYDMDVSPNRIEEV